MDADEQFEESFRAMPPMSDLEVIEILLGCADSVLAGLSPEELRVLRALCALRLPETAARALLIDAITRRLNAGASPPADGRN